MSVSKISKVSVVWSLSMNYEVSVVVFLHEIRSVLHVLVHELQGLCRVFFSHEIKSVLHVLVYELQGHVVLVHEI